MVIGQREVQVRKFVDEVWNSRNYEAAADLYSETYTNPFGMCALTEPRDLRSVNLTRLAINENRVELIPVPRGERLAAPPS